MRYQVQCVDTSGCQAKFSRARLQEAIGESLMEKLDRLQQQDEIQQAELEGLEACPFCEFKAIYPPVEEDREFVCKNPDCEIVSCRLCQQESHIPRTCAEANKEKNLPQRHLVEEAMSEALIRPCPKCKVKIVKDMGCNRMVCSKCRTAMCYVCRRDITRELYEHFERPPTYCPLHDNPALRSLQEIEKAQKDTIDSLLAQNPELKEEELRVHDAKDSAAKMSHVLQGHNNGLIRHLGQAPIHPNHVVYPGPAIPVGRANPPAVAHRVNAPFGNDNGWGGQGWLQNPLGQPRNPPGHPVPTNVVHRGANNRGNPLQDPARRVDTRPPWRY